MIRYRHLDRPSPTSSGYGYFGALQKAAFLAIVLTLVPTPPPAASAETTQHLRPRHRGQASLPAPTEWFLHHLELADAFAALGDMRRSIDELERASAAASPAIPSDLTLRLARAYYAQSEFGLAARTLAERMPDVMNSNCALHKQQAQICYKAQLLSGLSLTQMGAYKAGELSLHKLISDSSAVPPPAPGQLMGRLLAEAHWLRAMALARQGQLAKAETALAAPALAADPASHKLQLETQALIHKHRAHGAKSPELALGLSVVPGLGHAYLGQYGVALSSLVVNSLLFYFTHDSWRKSQEIPHYSRASALGFASLSLVFYGANFKSAYDMAFEANADRDALLFREWQQLFQPAQSPIFE